MTELLGAGLELLYRDFRSGLYMLLAAVVVGICSRKWYQNEKKDAWLLVCKVMMWAFALSAAALCESYLLLLAQDPDLVLSRTQMLLTMLRESAATVASSALVASGMGLLCRKKGAETAVYAQGFFILCVIEFVWADTYFAESWSVGFYALDYSLGFGSRRFIASVLTLLFGDVVTYNMVNIFMMLNLLLLALLISVMLALCIGKVDQEKRPAVVYLGLLLFASIGSFENMSRYVGRLEMYAYILVLLMAMWRHWFRNKPVVRYAGMIVLSNVMILIHQGNLFLFFPAIFGMLLMDQYQHGQWRKAEGIGCIITLVTICVCFIAVQFFGTEISMSMEEIIEYVNQRSNGTIGVGEREGVYYEYFSSIPQTYERINKGFFEHRAGRELPWISLTMTVVVLLPYLTALAILWKKQLHALQSPQKKTYLANPVFYLLLSFFSVVPTFILNVDWNRWYVVMSFVQFFLIFLMIYDHYGSMDEMLARLSGWVTKHRIASILSLLYLLSITDVERRGVLKTVTPIIYWLQDIFFKYM